MTASVFKKLDLRAAQLQVRGSADPGAAPAWAAQLEEVAAAEPADWGAALAFALRRLGGGPPDVRPLALVAARDWLRERGRPYARGLAALGADPSRLLLISVERNEQAIWALEETLKSGAVAGALAALEGAPFVATRRFDFAAQAGRAMGVMLRARAVEDLSAARVRWRIAAQPSAADPLDAKAPGPMRWRAELTRRRDGPPATFEWEEGDATPGLRLAPRLAGDGLVEAGQASFAA
jgi:protein ImuA